MVYYNHIKRTNFTLTTAISIIDDKIVIGWARCSSRDNFCRKTGRDIAFSRLSSNDKTHVLSIDDLHEFILNTIGEIPLLSHNSIQKIIKGTSIEDFNLRAVSEFFAQYMEITHDY